jgi:hypothetical protein
MGSQAHSGTVYVVDGTGGRAVGSLPRNHPAMFKKLAINGSFIIDVNVNHLVARFLDENSEIRDSFDIIKVPERSRRIEHLVTNPSQSCRGISLTWDINSQSQFYRVFRSEVPYKPGRAIQNTQANSYLDLAVTSGKPYYYSVQGVNASGAGEISAMVSATYTSADTDRDGHLDCEDLCLHDPLKTSPGICGCGNAEIGIFANGEANCSKKLDSSYQPTKPVLKRLTRNKAILKFDTFNGVPVEYKVLLTNKVSRKRERFSTRANTWMRKLRPGVYVVSYKIKNSAGSSKASKKISLNIR